MDEAGWHARRRAAKTDAYYAYPRRRADGGYDPVENVYPINEPWIGGFGGQPAGAPPPPGPPLPPGGAPPPPGTAPPPVPGSSQFQQPPSQFQAPEATGLGYTVPGYRPPAWIPPTQIPGATASEEYRQGATTHPGPPLTAVQRSNSYIPLAKMTPHLQFICGPLLRYDIIDVNGMWNGAAMIVTADAGSVYEPHPMLSLEWDPERPSQLSRQDGPHRRYSSMSSATHPHPAQNYPTNQPPPPMSPPAARASVSYVPSPQARREVVPGQEIYVYHGPSGSFTFWRFLIQVPLGPREMGVRYRVNGGQEIEFFVPGRGQNMRWATYSCNGFSAGVNPDDFKGPGHESGFDPLWNDLLEKHVESPFHCLVGGGDQIYCDAIMREPELQEYVHLKTAKEKIAYPLTDAIAFAMDRFFFSHCCLVFRNGSFAKANSSIPMVNMCDDHDLIDGFGSYPEDLQLSPIFRNVGSRGYFWYLLFQCFTNPTIDGTNRVPGTHTFKSTVIGSDGPWIPLPSHSIVTYLGPKIWLYMLDCRAERKKEQILTEATYQKIFELLYHLPFGVEHVIVQLGVPIAYPRMNILETALESKLNPLIALGRAGSLGLSNAVNKFNKDAELLDDLMDHWTARPHKQERNWFIERLQHIAKAKQVRITFLSGDVHCTAVGVFKTLTIKGKKDIPPAQDPRYMLNVITSAIVNTPPPAAVISTINFLADKVHKTMHTQLTDETMMPLFKKDTNGSTLKNKYVMGRRNWCSVKLNEVTGDLEFDIRVEAEKGVGRTVGYAVRAPPPRWTPS